MCTKEGNLNQAAIDAVADMLEEDVEKEDVEEEED